MDDKITIIHGAGGRETAEIIEKIIVAKTPPRLRSALSGYGLDVLDDGSTIKVGDKSIVFASDSFTIDPLFFPGGDIGHLAASGVLNDLVMMAADPVAFMDMIIVEEGLEKNTLEKIVESMINVLRENNVALIGGDFKVMPKGKIDKIIISCTGIGLSENPLIDRPRPGDKIVVTGPLAEHGAAILAARLGMLDENTSLRSDSRPLVKTVLPIIKKYREYITGARDPTRGGLAAILNEWSTQTGTTIIIDRASIPVREEVREFLDALGVDPLNVASEGVGVLSVRPEKAEDVIKELKAMGENPAIIGEVVEPPNNILRGRVVAVTEVGGRVIVRPNPLNLPRIC